jgi:predicted lipoprotein with Yx(FWY)xxD motif
MGLFGTRARRTIIVAVIAAAAVALASCGRDDGGGSSSTTASGDGTASAGGVSIQSIDGTDVLVDSDGRALYSADQEQGGKVLCTGSCNSIWDPVPASEGAGAPPSLDLGKVKGSNGEQLSYKGLPLYTFKEEGAGELKGDGVTDSFGGQSFSWHAATAGASGSSSAGGSPGASPSTGY